DHILVTAQRRPDLVVDGFQRVMHVFAPVVALDQGNRRAAGRWLRQGFGEQAVRQERARAAQEQTSRKISWHRKSLQSRISFTHRVGRTSRPDPPRRNFLLAGLAVPAAASAARPSADDQKHDAPLPTPVSSPGLRYRTLGKTGLKVTSVGFGCMITSDASVI